MLNHLQDCEFGQINSVFQALSHDIDVCCMILIKMRLASLSTKTPECSTELKGHRAESNCKPTATQAILPDNKSTLIVDFVSKGDIFKSFESDITTLFEKHQHFICDIEIC